MLITWSHEKHKTRLVCLPRAPGGSSIGGKVGPAQEGREHCVRACMQACVWECVLVCSHVVTCLSAGGAAAGGPSECGRVHRNVVGPIRMEDWEWWGGLACVIKLYRVAIKSGNIFIVLKCRVSKLLIVYVSVPTPYGHVYI